MVLIIYIYFLNINLDFKYINEKIFNNLKLIKITITFIIYYNSFISKKYLNIYLKFNK